MGFPWLLPLYLYAKARVHGPHMLIARTRARRNALSARVRATKANQGIAMQPQAASAKEERKARNERGSWEHR